MKRLILLLAVLTIFVSCVENKEKRYTYIKYERNLSGEKISEEEFINAVSDSVAIIEAYERYYISEGVFYEVAALAGDTSCHYEDLGFKLLNNDGVDISKTSFAGRDSILDVLHSEIVAPHKTKLEEKKQVYKKNEETVKQLKPYFTFNKDEFSEKTWVEPKDAPKYVDVNGIYCYFMLVDGKASNLRFKIQYRAEDWLFIQGYKFSIDGDAFDYVPSKIERDHSTYIWEWSDAPVTASSKVIIEALADAKTAKIRFVGQQYHKDKSITSQQIKSIKRTIDLYHALGGTID